MQSIRAFPKSLQIYSLNLLAEDFIGDNRSRVSSFRRVEYRSSTIPSKFFFGIHRVKLDDDHCIEEIDLSPYGFDTSDSHGTYLCDSYRGFAQAWTKAPVMWVDLSSRELDGTFSSCCLLGEEWGRISFYSGNAWDAGDAALSVQAEEVWQKFRQQFEELLARRWTAAEHARISLPVAPGNFGRLSKIALSMVTSAPFYGFDHPYRSHFKR